MQWLQLIRLILTIFPLLIDVVKSIENAIPDSGKGKEKLEAVKVVLESTFKSATDVVGSFEQVWPALSSAVSGIVAMLNAAGVFKKK